MAQLRESFTWRGVTFQSVERLAVQACYEAHVYPDFEGRIRLTQRADMWTADFFLFENSLAASGHAAEHTQALERAHAHFQQEVLSLLSQAMKLGEPKEGG